MQDFLDWNSLPWYLVKENKINCKQQERTVIWIVEISVLSSLLFLAGDVLRRKVQRKYPLFVSFFPLHGAENPCGFQTEYLFSQQYFHTHAVEEKKPSVTMSYVHSSGDVDLVKAVNGTNVASSFWMHEVSSFHNVAVCMQRLLAAVTCAK